MELMLINKLKKPMNRKKHLESIQRYFYVEKVLNKARLSLNLNKEMKINQIDYIKYYHKIYEFINI